MSSWLLIVNGDLGEGLALLRRLERLGHRSTLTPRPRCALELLEREDYDLVLIQARFLEAGGRQVIATQTPVVVTHAPEGSHIVCEWLEAGATDYLAPDACPARLGARIDAALAARRGLDFEADYREQVDRLLAAAAAPGRWDSSSNDRLARAGPWAGLARAFLSLAAENRALRASAEPTPAPADP